MRAREPERERNQTYKLKKRCIAKKQLAHGLIQLLAKKKKLIHFRITRSKTYFTTRMSHVYVQQLGIRRIEPYVVVPKFEITSIF